MATDGFEEEEDVYGYTPSLSIEFTMKSGETVSVREKFEEALTEQTIRAYAEMLIRQLGTDTVRTFAYSWEGEFYVDAIRMQEVAAVSVSTASADDDDDEDWEE
jgi:hypothetical protein